MLASRNGALGQTTKQAYVCQAAQRRGEHTAATGEHDGTRNVALRKDLHVGKQPKSYQNHVGIEDEQDTSFTISKYATRSREKKIRTKGRASSDGKQSSRPDASAPTIDTELEVLPEQYGKKQMDDADTKAFAEHVYTRTGQGLEDVRPGRRVWLEKEFLKQPPAARVTSLQKFIYGRSGKLIHELNDPEREQFMLQHRNWLAKRKERGLDHSTQKVANGNGQDPVLSGVGQSDEHSPPKRVWRAFVTDKGQDLASQEVFAEPGASFSVRKKSVDPIGYQSRTLLGGIEDHKAALLAQECKASNDAGFLQQSVPQAPARQEGMTRIEPIPSSSTQEFVADESYFTSQEQFLEAVSQQRAQHTDTQSSKRMRPQALAESFFQPSPAPASSTSRSTFAWHTARSPQQVRAYHSSARSFQQALAREQDDSHSDYRPENGESVRTNEAITEKPGGIRAQLRQWQELHGHEDDIMPQLPEDDGPLDDTSPYNSLTRLPSEQSINKLGQRAAQEEARAAFYDDVGKEGFEGHSKEQSRFLRPGDLVEVEFMRSERESMMAIYVRRVARGLGQYLMLNGRWTHMPDMSIPYSVTGWIDPKELQPLHKYLPNPETASDLDKLRVQAYTEDLDVPRDITAPLVARLQAFSDEVKEIYRRNASALDDAHNMLAHETDLRYGSLVSAATSLLKIPSDKLPLTALFTVRKALANGGFAFNIDRRSHRLTGYMQIRSKEQVRNVEQVRAWVRQWQDDLAAKASMEEDRRAKHRAPKGAQILYGFIEKSRKIISKQRENREPAPLSGNVGPSKTRLPITSHSDSLRIETRTEFTEQETEIVKFLEAWCCSNMFTGLIRIESLPPLILHAIGLYPDTDLSHYTGFLFLQELGTIMPHENRVRFDQHLLLPSSQHSKPLQNLMTSLLKMKDSHNLHDTMSDYRHDWNDLPVYCIDDAGAQEIDDGISIEDAGVDAQGKQQHWLHIHIANPTAFFSRDHPLAKMARHMGETLYMPERTYMMLPRWSTQGHFSLAPNRPCLSFSTKLNSAGEMVEYKIRPGIIRNVLRITYDEVESLVVGNTRKRAERLVLTVGGTPPSPKPPKSSFTSLKQRNHEELKTIMDLARARSTIRRRAGGIFFEQTHPDMSVWQSARGTGLGWDHPHRLGSRTVYGDPVVQLRTQRLENWFTASRAQAQVMVSESMLLCSEIAAKYCDERNIPAIYRGTISHDMNADHPKAQQWQDLLTQGKDLPMYLGVPYLQSLGYTVLRTQPLKHNYLGMSHYAKVTSPLRRYGDMILHWQIEAALKHEAETGQSMIVNPDDKTKHDRSFLPFSTPVLDTIMLGLQPRETMITRAKRYSNDFWATMLLFRMFHHKEGGAGPVPSSAATPFAGALPPGKGGFPFEKLTVFVGSRPEVDGSQRVNATCLELNYGVEMRRPEHLSLEQSRGVVFEQALQGDVWEVELDHVDVYMRRVVVTPRRLIAREGL
ncbi:putative ribonuclease II/R, nucleic acid-binding protein [Septoria linicola]|nr:putative ribonuclease II/R, nucleic acid-binding protein [Septoria linicola]